MEKTGMRRSRKAHAEHMELEHIIEKMGDAMRQAHLLYVAESGRLTPKIEMTLQEYKWYAMKINNVRRGSK